MHAPQNTCHERRKVRVNDWKLDCATSAIVIYRTYRRHTTLHISCGLGAAPGVIDKSPQASSPRSSRGNWIRKPRRLQRRRRTQTETFSMAACLLVGSRDGVNCEVRDHRSRTADRCGGGAGRVCLVQETRATSDRRV